MVLQVCTYVTGRSDRSITYAWFYRFVHMFTGRSDRSITYAWFYRFVHMLLVDQIGVSHMHGFTGLYICYW
jgi:hypothetical protein